MAKRLNGEGTYGTKIINGIEYKRYRDRVIGDVYAKTTEELKKKVAEKKKNIEQKRIEDNLVRSKLATFSDLCESWLPTVYHDISARTYDDYENIIKVRIKGYKGYDIANKQIKSILPRMFSDYFYSMADKYSYASIHKTWVVVQLVLKYGMKEGYVSKEFEMSDIKRPNETRVAKKKKDIEYIDLSDMEILYKELMSERYGNSARMLAFIMYSGLRISEATALKWNCVSSDYRTIKIRSANSRIVERDNDLKPIVNEDGSVKHKIIDKMPKSDDGSRTIPLPTRARDILKVFDEMRVHGKDDYVFVTSSCKPITASNARHCLKRVLDHSECECKNYSPHSLRHGYGSILISEGVDIKVVSELLGHSDVAFTYNVYIGISDKLKEKEVQRVFG